MENLEDKEKKQQHQSNLGLCWKIKLNLESKKATQA